MEVPAFDLNEPPIEADMSTEEDHKGFKPEMQSTPHQTYPQLHPHPHPHPDVFHCLSKLTENNFMTFIFKSEEEAGAFYNLYAKVLEFSIRKDTLTKHVNNTDVLVKSKKWVCSRQGEYKKVIAPKKQCKEPRSLTRVNCCATFRIKFNKDTQLYNVVHFVKDHSHPLGAKYSHFLRSHRTMETSDKAIVFGMHKVGFKTSHIMDYIIEI